MCVDPWTRAVACVLESPRSFVCSNCREARSACRIPDGLPVGQGNEKAFSRLPLAAPDAGRRARGCVAHRRRGCGRSVAQITSEGWKVNDRRGILHAHDETLAVLADGSQRTSRSGRSSVRDRGSTRIGAARDQQLLRGEEIARQRPGSSVGAMPSMRIVARVASCSARKRNRVFRAVHW